MKKGKGKWLPLTLLLAAKSLLALGGCDNGTSPTPTPEVPASTQVLIDGYNIGKYDSGMSPPEDAHPGPWQMVTVVWDGNYANRVGDMTVVPGRDVLEDGQDWFLLKMWSDAPVNMAQADYDLLKAKFQAAFPNEVVVDGGSDNVTIAAMLQKLGVRLAGLFGRDRVRG